MTSLLETLADQSRPVFDCKGHVPAVDVIEFLMIRPFIFYIVDFEANVRWHPVSTAFSVPADDFKCLT